jgi:hypothetical protein
MAITQHKRLQQLWILSLYNNVVTHILGKNFPPASRRRRQATGLDFSFSKQNQKFKPGKVEKNTTATATQLIISSSSFSFFFFFLPPFLAA